MSENIILVSFLAALRVVLPMGILMLIGFTCRVKNLIDRPSMKRFDSLLFYVFMPCLLFKNIYEIDFSLEFGHQVFLFTLICLVINFFVAITVTPKIIKDTKKAASVEQAIVRCNYILFGVSVSEAIYGEGKIGAVILLGTLVVPAINVLSAIILEMNRAGRANPIKLFIAILKNPMIIGAISAFIFKGLEINIPNPIWSVIKSLSNSTTTVSFISLGIGLEMVSKGKLKPLIFAVIMRMIFVPVVFLTLGVISGFKGEELCALMVVFAAPTAVASYPMAVAMGADGELAGQIVCVTTMLSLITIFLWVFGLGTFSLL